MTLRLKAASFAAFTLSAFAAVMASDATFATGAVAAVTQASPQQAILPVDATVLQPEILDETVTNGTGPVAPSAPAFATPAVQSPAAPAPASSLAQLVAAQSVSGALDAETRCLAGAVYFESKSESLAGQLAVARVVINRRDSGRFADSLCGVVYQPSQFSFVRGRSMPDIPTASRDWQEAVAIAQIAMKDSWDSAAEGALFFHAARVSPGWKLRRMASIDNHVFYR